MATQVTQAPSSSDYVLKRFFRLNWLLIYYVAILLDLISSSVKFVNDRLNQVRLGLAFRGKGKSLSLVEVLQSHKGELKKCPKHLAVILSRDTVQVDDLSKLIHWAMGLGVEYFSLYDPKGE